MLDWKDITDCTSNGLDKGSFKKSYFFVARPLRGEGGGKALVAGPLKKSFFSQHKNSTFWKIRVYSLLVLPNMCYIRNSTMLLWNYKFCTQTNTKCVLCDDYLYFIISLGQ